MAVRADGITADRYIPDSGNFFRHLAPRKDAALAGFCPLAHFDFKHAYSFVCGDLAYLVIVEVAFGIPYPVLGCTDLENDVGAALEVIGRQGTFTGVHPATGHFCPV